MRVLAWGRCVGGHPSSLSIDVILPHRPTAPSAGWLYTLGSCGFLYVDVLEYFTFTEPELVWLRRNISLSAMGSFWYGEFSPSHGTW